MSFSDFSLDMIGGFVKNVFSRGWFSMRLQFSITICLSFFTAGWYEVTNGNSLPAVFCFAVSRLSWVKGDLWQRPFYIFLWIPAYLEASFEVCKALFKCCFWRVCSKQSYSFAFDKASFYPRRVARAKMGILKGFRRLVASFDVQDGFFCKSLSFEHHCIQEGYFVLWYFGREFYCWVECISLFNENIHFMLFCSPKGRKRHQCNVSILLAWYRFVELSLFRSPPWIYFQKTLLSLCPLRHHGFGDNFFHWTQMNSNPRNSSIFYVLRTIRSQSLPINSRRVDPRVRREELCTWHE